MTTQYQYNVFGQVIAEYQSHSGAVDTSSTPAVQYSYADGSDNTARLLEMTYPSGQVASYSYGTSGQDGDMLSRVEAISFDSTEVVEYTYLGLKTFVQTEYPEPLVRQDLAFGIGANPYAGLDNFGRVIDCRWRSVESGADVERIQYGYDQASNRLWRHNAVAPSGSGNDELYAYDGLYRLESLRRGQLSPEPTVGGQASYAPTVTGTTPTQQWSLDATGNWSGFINSDALNPGDSLNQTRTHSPANEILSFAASYGATWAQPEYDAAGNMIVFPQPDNPTYGFTATYDAWNRQMSLVGISQYAYDGTNRRITKTVGDTIDDYYYSSTWQVLEDRQSTQGESASSESESSDQPPTQFLWGLRYIDDLVCRTTGLGRLYALQDANWNVTAILDYAGGIQERYRYTAYGVPEFLTPSFDVTSAGYGSFAWETLYAGYRWDLELGTYQVRNRDLEAFIGTWLTRDPSGRLELGSLYPYVLASPLNLTDPAGLSQRFKWPKACCDLDDVDEFDGALRRWERDADHALNHARRARKSNDSRQWKDAQGYQQQVQNTCRAAQKGVEACRVVFRPLDGWAGGAFR